MKCLQSIKYTMVATVLNNFRPGSNGSQAGGHWQVAQDPDTNEITRVWVDDASIPPRPGQSWDAAVNKFDIECLVSGFTNAGFLSTPNSQSFDNGRYIPSEIVSISFPKNYILNRSQYITSIRKTDETVLWMEEETGLPTVFEIQGVTPVFDPFGRHTENTAILRRSPIQ